MTHTEPTSVESVGGDPSGSRVGGVDGVRGGWVMAVAGAAPGSGIESLSVWDSFSDLWSNARQVGLSAIAVDIPIGLPCGCDRASDRKRRERESDVVARKLLKERRSSVFPAPSLCAIDAKDYEEANERTKACTRKGMSTQAFALFPKIKEVRELNDIPGAFGSPDSQGFAVPRVLEAHPEVSYYAMAVAPMRHHKGLQAGVVQRLSLLERHFPNVVEAAVRAEVSGPPHPGLDDVLDAVAAAWTARRAVSGTAFPLGGLATDRTGLPMTIWA